MPGNSGYSSSQIMSMQKDAVRRVNEMQRVAQDRLRRTAAAMNGGAPSPSAPPAPHRQPAKPNQPAAPASPPPAPVEGDPVPAPFQGFLDRLGLDQESTLLLVLLLLMVNEGADRSLILALVYILL